MPICLLKDLQIWPVNRDACLIQVTFKTDQTVHERVCYHFAKEENFYRLEAASVVFETLRKLELLRKKESVPKGSKPFPLRVTSNEKANAMSVVSVSLEGVPIPLNP